MDFLQRVRTNYFKICVESEKTPNSQGNTKKENQSWGHHNTGFQVVLQSCDHQDSMVLAQKQTHRSMEQNREPRNGPSTLWSTNIWQSSRLSIGKRTVSSINGAGKTGQPRVNKYFKNVKTQAYCTTQTFYSQIFTKDKWKHIHKVLYINVESIYL